MIELFLTGAVLILAVCVTAQADSWPSPTVPDSLGINIHFVGAPERDLGMIETAGFKLIRMDVLWNQVETTKGAYDFSGYDALTNALEKRGIRPLYILCYGNALYEPDTRGVVTPEGRDAFRSFAVAAVERFRGRGIIWELWNEPDQEVFWSSTPDPDGYMELARHVLPALRKADPQALLVAPALWTHWDYLETCFKGGLLPLIDAVSIHPYRQEKPTHEEQMPENAAEDYAIVRSLIQRYAPERPDLPIISSEWGYTTTVEGTDNEVQGRFLARSFLFNLSFGIPLSIWYDWRDDGEDPKEPGHNYGTVRPDYKPKPAYHQMQRLVAALKGTRFEKRLPSEAQDYLLLFGSATQKVLAAWTTGPEHAVEAVPGLTIMLDQNPRYLPIEAQALCGGAE